MPPPGQSGAGPSRTKVPIAVVVACVVLACGVLVAIAIPTLFGLRDPVPTGGYVDPLPVATGTGGSLLTASLATQVVREIWPAYINAAASGSSGDLANIASPGVVAMTIGRRFCGCGVWPPTFTSLELSAPPETAYPLYFAAEIDQPDYVAGAIIQIAVISKQSASAPWIVNSLAGYGGTSADISTGMDAVPPSSPLPPSDFQQWADVLAAERDTGQVPSSSLWQQWVDGSIGQTYVADMQQMHQNDDSSGFQTSTSLSVTGDSPSFVLEGGTASCANIVGKAVVTSASGSVTAGLGDFTGLAPGTYASVTETYDYQVCLVALGDGEVDMVGQAGGEYAVSADQS
jgi:hypothetical protein